MVETFGTNNPEGGVFSFSTAATLNSLQLSEDQTVLEKKFGDWDESKENLGKSLPHLSVCPGVYLTTSNNVSSIVYMKDVRSRDQKLHFLYFDIFCLHSSFQRGVIYCLTHNSFVFTSIHMTYFWETTR